MAQSNYNIPNDSAPAVRAQLNSVFQSIASNNSGGSAPATTFPHQWWYDTSTNILKQRNAANSAWINIGTFDQTGGTFSPFGVSQLTQGQAEDPTSTVFGTVSGQRLAQSDAGRSYGAIGTYAYLMFRGNIITEGQIINGSALSPAGHATTGDNPTADDAKTSRLARGASTMAGSWRVMGRVAIYPGDIQGSNTGRATLFLRVQ